MAAHNEPNAYREGDLIVFRMSSFGACIKSLAAALAGLEPAKPPAKLQTAFDAGHEWEDAILDEVEQQYQTDVVNRQTTFEWKLGKQFVFRGHPDGTMATSYLGEAVVDAKNLGKSYFRSFEIGGIANLGSLGIKYAMQGWLYCMAHDCDQFILAARNKDYDGPGIQVLCAEYHVDELMEIAGISRGGLRSKALAIKKAASDGNLLGAECLEEVWGCPMYYLHTDTGEEGLWLDDLDISPLEEEVIGGLVRADAIAKVKLAEAETAQKTARKALQNFINNQAPMPDVLTADTKETVKWKYEADDGTKIGRHQSSSSALDHTALKEAGIDINDYQKKSFHPVLRVTLPKENEND